MVSKDQLVVIGVLLGCGSGGGSRISRAGFVCRPRPGRTHTVACSRSSSRQMWLADVQDRCPKGMPNVRVSGTFDEERTCRQPNRPTVAWTITILHREIRERRGLRCPRLAVGPTAPASRRRGCYQCERRDKRSTCSQMGRHPLVSVETECEDVNPTRRTSPSFFPSGGTVTPAG